MTWSTGLFYSPEEHQQSSVVLMVLCNHLGAVILVRARMKNISSAAHGRNHRSLPNSESLAPAAPELSVGLTFPFLGNPYPITPLHF